MTRHIFLSQSEITWWGCKIERHLTFFQQGWELPTRLAQKLAEKHLNPIGYSKMKVKLAGKVLSYSVAVAIYI